MVAPGDLINKVTLIPQIPTADSFAQPTLPEVKGLFNLIQANLGVPGGGLFQNPLAGDLAACLGLDLSGVPLVTPSSGSIPGLRAQHLLDFPNPIDQDAALLSAFDDAESGLNDYQTHSNALINGGISPGAPATNLNSLADNIGPVISNLRVTQSIGSGLDISNPCNALNNVYGSILGDGAQLLANLVAALASLIAGAIIAALGPILAVIINEVAALLALLNELISFASSSSLVNLSLDPCAQALYNSAGTPALLGALPNLPNF